MLIGKFIVIFIAGVLAGFFISVLGHGRQGSLLIDQRNGEKDIIRIDLEVPPEELYHRKHITLRVNAHAKLSQNNHLS